MNKTTKSFSDIRLHYAVEFSTKISKESELIIIDYLRSIGYSENEEIKINFHQNNYVIESISIVNDSIIWTSNFKYEDGSPRTNDMYGFFGDGAGRLAWHIITNITPKYP